MTVQAADLASFDEAASAWVVAAGEYQFLVGASSADIKATLKATVKAQQTKVNNVLAPQTQLNLLKR
jgi:beta-glucosidase